MPVYLKLALLGLIVGPRRAADQLETDEGIGLLGRLIGRHYLNLFNLPVNEEVRIKLLLSNMLGQVPYPELPNSLRAAVSRLFGLLALGSRILYNNDIIPTIRLAGASVRVSARVAAIFII